ncbi:hypothetical protein DINM_020070 [Dirofilaria immitis]|nr:hypothetical protein [Dirofilaria immitis]
MVKTEDGVRLYFSFVYRGELKGDGLEPEQFRKMFIGGLSATTTDEALKEFYSQWGELVDCIVMRDPATKRSRGFGFVDAAMAARPHVIDGKTVDPKRAVPRDQSARSEANVSSKRLYVSGVREEHTEQMFEDYFNQFGKVLKVEIIADKNTGKPRGFAFISFDDYDPVDKCVLQKSHQIHNYRCDVKKALSKEEMAKAQQLDRERTERMGRSRGTMRPDRYGGGPGGYGGAWGGPGGPPSGQWGPPSGGGGGYGGSYGGYGTSAGGWGPSGDAPGGWGAAQGAWNGSQSASSGWSGGSGSGQGGWQEVVVVDNNGVDLLEIRVTLVGVAAHTEASPERRFLYQSLVLVFLNAWQSRFRAKVPRKVKTWWIFEITVSGELFNMSRIGEKIELCFQNGNYYEAHQIYRTLYNRMSNQGKWQELQNMLYSGVLRLLAEKEIASAIDLAELFVDVLEKSKTPVSSVVLDRFDELLNLLPAQLEKDLEANSEQEDRRLQYISLGIKWTKSVGDKKRYRRRGHPELHFRIAKLLWREGNYVNARNHFMYSENPEIFALFLTEYQMKYGYTAEKDLFIAQAVMQMLCDRRLKSALKLLQSYCDTHPDIRSGFPYPFPLLNFLHFAIICIAKREVTYFTVLVEQYENEINRDPEYKQFLDRIGQIYFNLPQPQTARGGFLGNMIKGLLKTPGNESAEEYENDSEEAIYISPDSETECVVGTSKSKPASGEFPMDAAQSDIITDDMDLD